MKIAPIQINYGTKISVKVWNTDEQDNTQLDFCVFPFFARFLTFTMLEKNLKCLKCSNVDFWWEKSNEKLSF